jgi:hypothetical protein
MDINVDLYELSTIGVTQEMLDRIVRAVEKVRERCCRAVRALDAAGIAIRKVEPRSNGWNVMGVASGRTVTVPA